MRTATLVAVVLLAAAVSAQQPRTDSNPPVLQAPTLSPAPDGNGTWRRTAPVTLRLAATDDVAVTRLEYSLDNGATYVAAPITPAPSVGVSIAVTQQGNTLVRYRAFDAAGNQSAGESAAAGRGGRGGGGARGAPPVAAGPPPAPVMLDYRTIAVQIDSRPPVAEWPGIVIDNQILQSQTLVPSLSDPQGSGGVGIWRMEVDGAHVYPFPIALNTLTAGRHTQAVTLRDIAGNSATYTRTFTVTTSFADLDAVLAQYADNALKTTLAVPASAGDAGLRLTSPFGFRTGQTLVIGAGAERETVTIASVPSPPPPQQGANILLSAPLTLSHGAGPATPVTNPRPRLAGDVVTRLRAQLKQAGEKSAAGDKAAATDLLRQFVAAVQRDGPAAAKPVERAALTSAGQALIDQLQGKTLEAIVMPLTVTPAPASLRVFTDPTPLVKTPGATYRVLVSGQTNAFRHEHIVDTEAMVQKLGAANGFDVDIWDQRGTAGPGRQIPAGVSLTASPFADLATLRQYKTVVLASTVGREPSGTFTPAEYANFQAYIRGGGGVVAIHGATDAYQNVPWWVDLVGGGFSGHGGNVVGIQPDCMSCGEVELVTADATHPATSHLAPRFATHDELYNTSRNPVELGLVHPLVWENEATLVGQINYNPGPLMNSDRHAMVWCRNFEGGRSFTSVIGHNWELTHDPWYQQMIVKGIQTTAGIVPSNCVTYGEVAELVPAGSPLASMLASARAEYERGDFAAAVPHLEAMVKATSIAAVRAQGQELISWMKGFK